MNDEKKKSLTTNNRKSVQLHNNGLNAGSLIDTALKNLNQEQVSSLMEKAAEEALRLEVKSNGLSCGESSSIRPYRCI